MEAAKRPQGLYQVWVVGVERDGVSQQGLPRLLWLKVPAAIPTTTIASPIIAAMAGSSVSVWGPGAWEDLGPKVAPD